MEAGGPAARGLEDAQGRQGSRNHGRQRHCETQVGARIIPVVVAVLMVAFTRAALSQNALQSERFLGFDDTANSGGGDTGQPYYDASCWWYLPSAQGGYL